MLTKTNTFNMLEVIGNSTRIKQITNWKLKTTFLKIIFQSVAILFSFQGWAQTNTYTNSGTYTVPAGVHYISVECIGGGGGGGRIDGGASGGGGGGAYVKSLLTVTPGATYSYNVGNGGSGASNINPGGDSWFGSVATVMAKGGSGTPNNTTTGSAGGSASSSIGDIKYSGGNGGNGSTNTSTNGGGGGGAAGASGNGSNGVNLTAGNGVSPGGNGGNGRTNSSNNYGPGLNGSNYGGGGGGAVSGGAWYHNVYNGGNGASGMVRITVIPAPVSSFSNYSADPTLSTSFAHRKGANSKPKFTVKSTLPFNEIQFELNTQSNFSGTAFVSTINDGTTYAGNTLFDFWTTATLSGADQTYFARCRVSSDGGLTYGPWTTNLWPYSYFPATLYPQEGWYYTTGEQFLTGVVQELTYDNTVVNTTPFPDNGNITLNQGTFNINAGNGDAVYERTTFYQNVNYMTIGWQNDCNGNAAIFNGFPFTVNIPRSSLIQSAIFSLTASESCQCESQTVPLHLIADAHNIDNADPISSANITSLTGRTSANTIIDYTPSWSSGNRYTLGSVDNILQEIVNRGGWNAGNNFNLLLRWNPAYTAGSKNNRCLNQADNGSSTAPRIVGTFTNYKNTVNFPAVNRAIYGPLGTAWDELKISDNTTTCISCYTEYRIHDAGTNAVLAGPFTRVAGLSGSQSFTIASVTAQNIYVSASVYRTNASPQINDVWLTTITPSPLPIELTSFAVACENDEKVNVSWETASELNSSHFIVQRSEDLISWVDVAKIPAKGNTNLLSKYKATDVSPNRGTNYYRLVQYDFNGKHEAFDPISTVCQVEKFSVTLFPNPSQGEINLRIESESNMKDVLAVFYDASGKMIFSEKMNIIKGVTHYTFPDLNLSKGNYILKLSHPSKEIRSMPIVIN